MVDRTQVRMSSFLHVLTSNESRRPGFTAIYWGIRKQSPHRPWREIIDRAKIAWHAANPVGVPR